MEFAIAWTSYYIFLHKKGIEFFLAHPVIRAGEDQSGMVGGGFVALIRGSLWHLLGLP